jgi:hypothetical protein
MPNISQIANYPGLVSLVLLWTLIWKGIALWQAATKRQLTWFIILLAVNTVGLLEIAYIFYLHRFDLGSQKLLQSLKNIAGKKK